MKTVCAVSTFCLRFVACVGLVLWVAGCASMRVDWGARIGHYTYDQAVTDMGPPDKQAKLKDGTVVAEWLVDHGYTYAYNNPGPYGPFSLSYVSTYTAPSRYMRLTFGPDSQLSAWKRFYK